MKRCFLMLFVAVLAIGTPVHAQDSKENKGYVFSPAISLKYTPVKDQSKSGTCWSFATVSFLESELLRTGKGSYDLSEMFFVHHAYINKGERFVRYQGTSNFGPGGQAHDVINVLRTNGIATEQEYPGLIKGELKHDHSELDAVLHAFLKAVVDKKGNKLTAAWPVAYQSILNSYLGEMPDKSGNLVDNSKKSDNSKTLGLNPDDYIELTSYTHHPFYSAFQLEIPDNWSGGLYYNLPIDELVSVMHNSLKNGYTVCWDGDVSDRGFSHGNSLAIIPEIQPVSNEGTEMAKWEKMTDKERNELAYNFKEIRKEKNITQEMRQVAFNNYQATDDHLMHIVGVVNDQNNKPYFVVKNSWADNSNSNGGLLNMSEAYVRLNTIAILVHKNAIPADIKKKLNL